jgi:hypothetical protein
MKMRKRAYNKALFFWIGNGLHKLADSINIIIFFIESVMANPCGILALPDSNYNE